MLLSEWEDCDDDMCGVDYDQSSLEEEENEEAEAVQLAYDETDRIIIDSGGEDSIFPPLDGTAFYETICRINHSCEPNVAVKYISSSKVRGGLSASLVSLRDIYPAEELLQSYIETNMSTEKRQLSLRDYGFMCTCIRCTANQH